MTLAMLFLFFPLGGSIAPREIKSRRNFRKKGETGRGHKKTLICDVLALKKKNLELLISGMRWPVSETLFFKLVNFVSREYINEIKNLTGKNYKIAVLEIRFLNLLIKIMHFNYLKNLAKKNKYTLEYSVSSKEFLYPDWKKIESLYERFYTPIGNTWNRKVKKSRRRAIIISNV